VSSSQRVVAGLGIVAAGIALFLVVRGSSGDTSCELTAGGAAIVTEGILHGHDTAAIVGSLGSSVATESACKAAVGKLVNSPSETVPLKVEDTPVETSGFEVEEAPPEPQESSLSRDFACLDRYPESEFLFDLCAEEIIQ
jgi:hypothetical protein